MATNLDLEEQEQLDQLKHFWSRYGNLLTAILTIALLAYAGWSGWNWWQRNEAAKASALFDQLELAVQANDGDRAGRVFADLKERHASTTFTGQAGLLAAKVQFDKGQADAARASLEWVAGNANEPQYRSIAKLRLAGILMDEKKYDEALKQVSAVDDKDFAALAEDRRGDILLAQGNKDGAKAAYLKAWLAMDQTLDYRRVVEAKLTSMGAAPTVKPVLSGAAK